jgi:hypothetical protein
LAQAILVCGDASVGGIRAHADGLCREFHDGVPGQGVSADHEKSLSFGRYSMPMNGVDNAAARMQAWSRSPATTSAEAIRSMAA